MSSSLPARPSLEQLKKLAKDLAKAHEEKQPDALALIGRHLPALAGKSALEIAAYPFALTMPSRSSRGSTASQAGTT